MHYCKRLAWHMLLAPAALLLVSGLVSSQETNVGANRQDAAPRIADAVNESQSGQTGEQHQPHLPVNLTADPASCTKVTAHLEAAGHLLVQSGDDSPARLPLRVDGQMEYEERRIDIELEGTAQNPQAMPPSMSLRFYRKATAEIRVADEPPKKSVLAPDRRLIAAKFTPSAKEANAVAPDGDEYALYSPLGPMTRQDLELIHLPGSSLLAPLLLPGRPVMPGDTWKHEDRLIAALFGLDAVGHSTVKSTLKEATADTAVCMMEGTIGGAVAGVSSDIEMRGRYDFDRGTRQITWLALAIKEKRSIGHVAPGLDVAARLRVWFKPADIPVELDDASLKGISLAPDAGSMMLLAQPESKDFEVLHDRRWYVTQDIPGSLILRFIRRGDFLAQCNFTLMEPTDEPLPSLEEFQNDVKQSFDQQFRQFVGTPETVPLGDATAHRLEVAGTSSDVAMQWRYYLIQSPQGQRLAAIFSLEEKLAESFGAADRTLMSGLRFRPSEKPEQSE